MGLNNYILDNLTTVVLLFDRELKLTYLNPAGENLLGISCRKALNMPLIELVKDERFVSNIQEYMAVGQGYSQRDMVFNVATQAVKADAIATPLPENLAGALLLEIIPTGPHERLSRDETRLNQQHATRAVVRGLAHEIKNPLGGLRGAAQLLERELYDDALKEYTRIIIGEADRLQNLLNRLLAPNKPPAIRPLNIHRVVEHVYQLIMAEKSVDIQVSRDYDPSIPEIFGDQDQLIQALLNIARNAIQALAPTGGKILLKTRTERSCIIAAKRHKWAINIEIIDNGPGVPESIKEKIFYPMVTGRAEGTGLGLSIAQALIHYHGGLLEFERIANNTVFRILLPMEHKYEP